MSFSESPEVKLITVPIKPADGFELAYATSNQGFFMI